MLFWFFLARSVLSSLLSDWSRMCRVGENGWHGLVRLLCFAGWSFNTRNIDWLCTRRATTLLQANLDCPDRWEIMFYVPKVKSTCIDWAMNPPVEYNNTGQGHTMHRRPWPFASSRIFDHILYHRKEVRDCCVNYSKVARRNRRNPRRHIPYHVNIERHAY